MTLDLTPRAWHTIEPADAIGLDLHRDLHISAPLNEEGKPCPWPWEPQQFKDRPDAPIGMYHCGYCGAMVLAGVPHIDYAEPPRETQQPPLP